MSSRLSRLLSIESFAPASPLNAFVIAPAELEVQETATERLMGHDPELSPREEAIFLLHTAAEVEHALLIQYLYAGFSLGNDRLTEAQQEIVDGFRRIFSIATEEMGHLASVQNLLRLIGGPLTFEREDFPFRNEFYPFRFKLEPMTKDSLAKYVFAEMPADLTSDDPEEMKRLAEIRKRANRANEDKPVNHVGTLYKAIAERFRKTAANEKIADEDIQASTVEFQASPHDWDMSPPRVLLQVKTRDDAIGLIEKIAAQGEGLTSSDPSDESHYKRFRAIYDKFPEDGEWKDSEGKPVQPAREVPTNPNTTPGPDADPGTERDLQGGRITNQATLLWAKLLNLRYRKLLIDISHAFQITNHDLQKRLSTWAIDQEMLPNVAGISGLLVKLPLRKEDTFGPPFAGPTFEMDYTLALPDREPDRWRLHRDLIIATQMLTKRIRAEGQPNQDQQDLLNELESVDAAALKDVIEPQINL